MNRLLWTLGALLLIPVTALWPCANATPISEVARAPDQKTPTNVEPLRFTVTFSEPVLGFAAEDVALSGGASALVREVLPNDGTTYEVTLSSITEDGTICPSIPAGAVTGLDGTPGAASSSVDSCVVLDRLGPPPPLTLDPVDNAATPSLSPRFAWMAPSDLSGIAKYEVEIRGPKVRDYTTTRTSYTPTLGVAGTYTWRIHCLDRAGNVGEWTPWRVLTLDDAPPSSPQVVSSSLAVQTWSRADAIEVVFEAAVDSGSGIAGYTVQWSHSASSPVGGPANRGNSWTTESLSVPEDGEWWCHVVALDRAGNRSAVVDVGPFRIDRSPPTLVGIAESIRLPNDPGRLAAIADWSSVTAIDVLDPAPSIRFSVPEGSLLPIGRSEVTVTLEDHAGNVLVRAVSVVVYNTEAPDVRIIWPTSRESLLLGEARAPRWNTDSLAPIDSVRTDGVVDGCLDTRTPGRHEFTVTVVDATGLEASASVEYVVRYVERRTEVVRVRPDGSEEWLWASTPIGFSGTEGVALRSSEWLRIRCRVDPTPEGTPRPPITFSLVRTDSAASTVPIIERTGLLTDDGETYTADLPLALFHPGQYTCWVGFVDGSNESFSFRLVR